jgi:nucleoside-diphosphate-sugar epimerase
VGEYLLKGYRLEFGLDYSVARIFNAYGTRESPMSPHVIPDFVKKSYEYKKDPSRGFEIIGDGEQTRAYTWVEDIVEGLVLMAERDEAIGEAINLGTSEEVKVIDLARMILEIVGLDPSTVEFKHLPSPKGDIKRRSADISKAKRLLGWYPKTSLREGLERTVAWLSPRIEAMEWVL